jgi:hypothetical protein
MDGSCRSTLETTTGPLTFTAIIEVLNSNLVNSCQETLELCASCGEHRYRDLGGVLPIPTTIILMGYLLIFSMTFRYLMVPLLYTNHGKEIFDC